jgi:lipoprotein-anchoring transpeptidase ErfK/SrfK
LLSTKTSETLEGIFSQKGALYGSKDFSNSYVEVSIDNQKVWMYINGECILETPVVTGNVGKNMGTRKAIFSLTYKTKNAVLRGADYETPVSFWMPFDGGIGLHDATWRGSFGGTIYKWNGSHGCVNMPYNAAKKVYENIDKTMPIIVW